MILKLLTSVRLLTHSLAHSLAPKNLQENTHIEGNRIVVLDESLAIR